MKDKRWFDEGFGLSVIDAISKRIPKWESGVFHKGGISTGVWVLAHGLDSKTAKRIEDVLSLYETEKEFIDDN